MMPGPSAITSRRTRVNSPWAHPPNQHGPGMGLIDDGRRCAFGPPAGGPSARPTCPRHPNASSPEHDRALPGGDVEKLKRGVSSPY